MVSPACAAVKPDGSPCRAAPLQGGTYCRLHSPAHTAEVAEARRLGGLRRRREATVRRVYDVGTLDSVAQIRRLVEIAITDTLELENSIARARTLTYQAQTAIRLLEVGEVEQRLAALEEWQRLEAYHPA